MPNIGKLKNENKLAKVVFIDRDGVINEDPIGDYVKRWEDFRFIPGALDAMKQLVDAGYGIIIISNQAGIGDGVYTKAALDDITVKMTRELEKNKIPIKGIYYCLHGKEANCECRKPKIGLFKQAAHDISFDKNATYFIGDKQTDMQAGESFGLKTIFVLTGHGKNDQRLLKNKPEQTVPSLKEAVAYMLKQ